MGELNQDPSMEEILASIKRVISEDGRAAPAAPRPQRSRRSEAESDPFDEAEPEEDVLELEQALGTGDGLLSEDKAAASRQSLAALAAVREPGELPRLDNDGALESIVREMLKPMLKQWLDQRLPDLVEEMVSKEIARITGKRL
jgi:cell pole-organizing protein PopZ